jgi:hypothetical protein
MHLHKLEKKMGVSVIARDYERNVLATICTTMHFIINLTKAMAAWKTVNYVKTLGFQ